MLEWDILDGWWSDGGDIRLPSVRTGNMVDGKPGTK